MADSLSRGTTSTVRPRGGAPERLLTVAEAADTLRVSTKTVRRLVGRGELAAVRVGRQLRIAPAALAAYLRGGPLGA